MEEYTEKGPRWPKSELERLAETLVKDLNQKFGDMHEEVAATCTIDDNPPVVRISLRISTTKPSKDTAFILNHFHEDVQQLLEDHEVKISEYGIEFKSVGEHEQTVIIKSRT